MTEEKKCSNCKNKDKICHFFKWDSNVLLNYISDIACAFWESDRITEKKCKFYHQNYCEPCKSPTDFSKCDLVKIGNQIIVDKFIEQINNL